RGRRVREERRLTYPVLLALFFLSGACGLVYQVVWLRKLSLVFGTTTFAVSAVISSFMAGLGLGSYLSGRFLAHRGRALRLFGMMEIGVGLYALALPGLLHGPVGAREEPAQAGPRVRHPAQPHHADGRHPDAAVGAHRRAVQA